MKKEFTHYGEKATLLTNVSDYENILEKNNVAYKTLPIISQKYRVIEYDGKYAIALTRREWEDAENVIVIEKFPSDLDLDALITDVLLQAYQKTEPKPEPSTEKVLIKMAQDFFPPSFDDMINGKEPDEEEYFFNLRVFLGKYGGVSYLKTLPHDDIDEEFWEKLISK